MNNIKKLICKLEYEHSLTLEEYLALVEGFSDDALNYIAPKALKAKQSVYGDDIYIRGLIEISNSCKNNCNYCGIRAGNTKCDRYRLTEDEILSCCKEGYRLGFRTFVLQGGEDNYYTDDVVCSVVAKIKELYPKCAVTLSLGERSFESYKRLFDAGADRYLLRHETIDKEHYNMLHPESMNYENRIKCLYNLKEIGYQTGCGFMVGSPYQTTLNIAKDLKFIEEFKPHMCGIGPFIPHKDTEYARYEAGSASLTCYLLAIIRLIKPNILLPATTALATLSEDGRTKGILCGANVVMPNLSPKKDRAKYSLYDNKAFLNTEAAEGLKELKANLNKIGAKIVTKKGDIKNDGNI
jgi:biotin synthase